MIRDSITIQDMVDFLNKIAQDDSRALSTMMLTAFKCNSHLTEADYITVSRTSDDTPGLGFAAFLGSLFGRNENGEGPVIIDATKNTIAFKQESMPTDPDAYAKRRGYERMHGLDSPDYTIDEKRVVKYLDEIAPGIGAGHDPIGFLMAAHAALSTSAMHQPLMNLTFPSTPEPGHPIGIPPITSTSKRSVL